MKIEKRSITADSLEGYFEIRRRVYADDSLYVPMPEGQVFRVGQSSPDNVLLTSFDGSKPVASVLVMPDGRTSSVGLFECVPDYAAAGVSVLREACVLLQEYGAAGVIGPRESNLLQGLQISGFELPHLIFTHRNPPFYREIFEDAGFSVSERLLTFLFDAESVPMARYDRRELHVRRFDRQKLDREVAIFHDIQNAAFGSAEGYSRRSLEETKIEVESLLSIVDDDLILIAESPDGVPLGTLIVIPDHNQLALDDHIDRARILSIASVAGKAGLGVGAVMASRMRDILLDKGYRTAIVSFVRSRNSAPQILLKRRFHARPGMEYALYEYTFS